MPDLKNISGRPKKIAVVGGGWAGLAAAVESTRLGHSVSLFEMAPQLGGRARQIDSHGMSLDNGQHILIGAYSKTLAMMRFVGVDTKRALMRMPLRIAYPDKNGLQLKPGRSIPAFASAVMRHGTWTRAEKWALLRMSIHWLFKRFQCSPALTVGQLIEPLPLAVKGDLLEPLCVAALNTPADRASAQVFLRVLQDALFSGPGSSDLLLPRWRLSRMWPEPAAAWLAQSGCSIRLSCRVDAIERQELHWHLLGERFDGVVLASSALEAARLLETVASEWASLARGLTYEPIVTVYAHSPETRLPLPMMALRANANEPAQFVFDLGAINGMDGVLAFVISGASGWVDRGNDATMAAVLRQGQRALLEHLASPLVGLRTIVEKRATFLCTPGLKRPCANVAPALAVAGDYVDGPYPSSLEGAVRSGVDAARAVSAINDGSTRIAAL